MMLGKPSGQVDRSRHDRVRRSDAGKPLPRSRGSNRFGVTDS